MCPSDLCPAAARKVLFMHGGGHGQFAAVPLNLCSDRSQTATYVVSGTWSQRACAEAQKYCNVKMVNKTAPDYTSFPELTEDDIAEGSKFIWVCSNETVNGVGGSSCDACGGNPLGVRPSVRGRSGGPPGSGPNSGGRVGRCEIFPQICSQTSDLDKSRCHGRHFPSGRWFGGFRVDDPIRCVISGLPTR